MCSECSIVHCLNMCTCESIYVRGSQVSHYYLYHCEHTCVVQLDHTCVMILIHKAAIHQQLLVPCVLVLYSLTDVAADILQIYVYICIIYITFIQY